MTYLVCIGTTFCCVKTCPGLEISHVNLKLKSLSLSLSLSHSHTCTSFFVFCVETIQWFQHYHFIDLQVFNVIASFGMHVCGSNIKQQPKKTNHTATNAS